MATVETLYITKLTKAQIKALEHMVDKKLDYYRKEKVTACGKYKENLKKNTAFMLRILDALEGAKKDET